MILKINKQLKSKCFIFLLAVFIFSCDDDVREVTLFEKGQTQAEASSTTIDFGETVSFTSTSVKALTTNWTFQGGSPATSINPNVDVTYNEPGTFEAKLVVKYIDNTIETITFAIVVKGIDPALPFGGTPVDLPGVIEAENYDLGGEGVGYHDFEEENLAVANGSATYRQDDGVDIVVGTQTYISYTNEGEWTNYTVNVTESGAYDFEFMVASGSPAGGSSIKLQSVNQNTGVVTDLGQTGNFANTGGWNVFTGRTIEGVNLAAGSYTLRFYFTGGDTNLDKVNVSVGVPAGPINGLGIYTEREITAVNNAVMLPVNNANFVISQVGNAAHGNNALYYKFDPANSSSFQTWGAMATMITNSPVNATGYNYYNLSLKTTSTYNLRVRIKLSSGSNHWVTLNSATTDATYGMARDGQWHNVKIPLTDFNANLSSIAEILVLRSDDADFGTTSPTDTSRNFDWYVDDVFLSVD